jgi:hypothetical protein
MATLLDKIKYIGKPKQWKAFFSRLHIAFSSYHMAEMAAEIHTVKREVFDDLDMPITSRTMPEYFMFLERANEFPLMEQLESLKAPPRLSWGAKREVTQAVKLVEDRLAVESDLERVFALKIMDRQLRFYLDVYA